MTVATIELYNSALDLGTHAEIQIYFANAPSFWNPHWKKITRSQWQLWGLCSKPTSWFKKK